MIRYAHLVLIVLYLCVSGHEAYRYLTYNLNQHCGRVISLPCRRDDRAGTLRLAVPSENCTVSIQIDSASCYKNYAIYYNLRQLALYSGANITVSETTHYGTSTTTTIRKQYTSAPHVTSYAPTSVDQFLTQFSSLPSITIAFNTTTVPSIFTNALIMDYNVIHQDYDSSDTYCGALGGYVLDELICETDDRVTCPTLYSYTPVLSYVRTKEQGYQSVCNMLGAGEITGIVVGSILAITFFAVLIAIVLRQRNHRVIQPRSCPPGSYQGGPVVITSGHPGQQPYQSAVYPTPHPTGEFIMPDPPKQQY